MPPLERNSRRPAVDLNYLPSEYGHHPLERLVARVKARLLGVVILVLPDERIVRPDAQHVVAVVLRPAVEGEGIGRGVDGPPVIQRCLEGGLDFPVLDEVLNQGRKTSRSVVHLLG